MKLIFFGSAEFSIYTLDELKLHDILPDFIVTLPDKPRGRKLIMTQNIVGDWARKQNIESIAPASLKNNQFLIDKLKSFGIEESIYLVAAYGKIIPRDIFEIPKHKTLNIHPSLLSKYRGASPIQSQILSDEQEVGVTIMQIEEAMDAGPIIVQKKVVLDEMPAKIELEKILAREGARLFAHILPEWMQGVISPIMQNEAEASYCKKIEKKDGELEINLNNLPHGEAARKILLKIKAFEGWPGTYFFHNQKRIIVSEAVIKDDRLQILRVIPEGKSEMDFEDFKRGLR